MATLVIIRGHHEMAHAKEVYWGVPGSRIVHVTQARSFLRGDRWDEIIFTQYCMGSPSWNSHVVPGVEYQKTQGAVITCLVS